MAKPATTVALLYEHPTWSSALLERMAGRGIDVVTVDVGRPSPAVGGGHDGQIDRWINRVNTMPSAGRPPSVVAATGHLLLGLELRGERVVNGHRTWALGASKAAQLELFGRLDLDVPDSVLISDPCQAPAVAAGLGYPVLIKPNVGGSGAGITRHEDPGALADAIASGDVDLGVDGTGLVQRAIEAADGLVHRVEMLGTELFYATDQAVRGDVFNYCAADGCRVDEIALVDPDPEVLAAARAVMEASRADVAGVEYLVDPDSGRPSFFDFNPYSNLVSGREAELGFDPIDRYLDSVLG